MSAEAPTPAPVAASKARRILPVHLASLAVYTLLALITLGPLDPRSRVWGGNNSDVVNHLSMRAWQASEAAGGRPLPSSTTHLLFPDGGSLWIADVVGGTLVTPAVWALGPVAASNLLVLLNLVFACWAMFWLVRRRTGDPWAALLAGALFGLCPLTLGHVNNGVTEQLQTGWLPLFVGALWALFEDAQQPVDTRRTVLRVLATGALWWIAAVASQWYYGMYACLLMALAVVLAGFHRCRLGFWIRAGAASAVFALSVLPMALRFFRQFRGDGLLTRAAVTESVFEPAFSADPAFFFAPRAPLTYEGEAFFHLTYIGFLLAGISIWGLFRSQTRRTTCLWLASALLFMALALGPDIALGGEPLEQGRYLAPYRWLMAVVPFFEMMDFPYRFFVLVYLFLALAAGTGLAQALKQRRLRGLLFMALLALFWLETAYLSGAPVPGPRLPVEPAGPVQTIRDAPRDTAVFDLPLRLKIPAVTRYVLNQLHHKRPIVYCSFLNAPHPFPRSLAQESLVTNVLYLASNHRVKGTLSDFRHEVAQEMKLLGEARQLMRCLVDGRPCAQKLRQMLQEDKARLAKMGLTHFMLHSNLHPRRSPLPGVCQALFGPAVKRQDGVSLYLLR